MQLDKAANLVINEAITKRGAYVFRETDEMCSVCQHDLEIYYCENRTYMLRCSMCDFVAITRAGSPREASEKVGLNVKPVRHGRWFIKANAIDRTFTCSECRKWIIPTTNALMNYCPNCGAKMDAEVEG